MVKGGTKGIMMRQMTIQRQEMQEDGASTSLEREQILMYFASSDHASINHILATFNMTKC